jgi:hypothetical protein
MTIVISNDLPNTKKVLSLPGYNPANLLDILIEGMKVECDAGLARKLQVGRGVISKIRNRQIAITSDMLIRMHEVSELPISSLRIMMGLPPRILSTEMPKESEYALVG